MAINKNDYLDGNGNYDLKKSLVDELIDGVDTIATKTQNLPNDGSFNPASYTNAVALGNQMSFRSLYQEGNMTSDVKYYVLSLGTGNTRYGTYMLVGKATRKSNGVSSVKVMISTAGTNTQIFSVNNANLSTFQVNVHPENDWITLGVAHASHTDLYGFSLKVYKLD